MNHIGNHISKEILELYKIFECEVVKIQLIQALKI